MRRRHLQVSEATGAPEALRSGFRHHTWLSAQETRDWYLEHIGSEPWPPCSDAFWQMRWSRAVSTWARKHGIVDPQNSGHIDHVRIRALGIHRVSLSPSGANHG